MQRILKIVDILMSLYLLSLTLIFLLGFLVVLKFLILKNPVSNYETVLRTLVFGILSSYSTYKFIKREHRRCSYALLTLSALLVYTTIHRLLFITNFSLDITDLKNLIFFGIPIIITFLVKRSQKTI